MTQKITIIIPVYNEEHRLRYLFAELPDHKELELIFVLNSCQDRSEEVIQKNSSSFQQTLIRIASSKRGKGTAIRHGLSLVSNLTDVVGWTDADGNILWNDLLLLAAQCRKTKTAVFGFRKQGQRSRFRQLISKTGNYLARSCIQQELPNDIGCPAKFFPIQELPQLTESGWGIDLEAVLKTKKFIQNEITGRDRGPSHFNFWSILENTANAIRLIWKHHKKY